MKKYNANIELKIDQESIMDGDFNLVDFEMKLNQMLGKFADTYNGVDVRLGLFHNEMPTIAERYAEHKKYVKELQLILADEGANLPKDKRTIVFNNKLVSENLDWLEIHCKHPFRIPTNHSDFNREVIKLIKLIRETYIEGADKFVA
jgi:hypothetical protein